MLSDPSSLALLLRNARSVAIIGLSAQPQRPSHEVAQYLQRQGYRIIPINPTYAGTHILGELCYPTLTQAARALSPEVGKIDIVDCFRRPEYVDALVDEAIGIGAGCVWMQLGVENQVAAERAEAAGMHVVMDKCMKIEHGRLIG